MNDTSTATKIEPQPTGVVLEHNRQLWQARFSPCGRFLVGGSYDASIERWAVDGDTFTPLPAITGHDGWTQCIGFDPQSQRIYSADSWGRLACWPLEGETPEPLWKLPEAHRGWIRTLAVSPDGKSLATGGNDSVVRIWSAADGSLQYELPHEQRVFSLAFHPDGTSLVSGDLLGVIRHWQLEGRREARQLDASVLYQLDRIQQCGGARHLAFDAAGDRLACAGQKTPGGGFATGLPCVLVFDWSSGQLLREMQVGGTQDGFAYDAQFHPDGFVMATSCAFPGKGHVWFWRPDEEKALYESNKITNGRSLSLHPDGERLALLVSNSPNGNGRQLVDGEYPGGSAKIHILRV